MRERARVCEWERERKRVRKRDNKSMLNPSLPDSQFRETNLRWPPFLRISLVSFFGSWTRDPPFRRPIAAARYYSLDFNGYGHERKFIRYFASSSIFYRRANAIDVERSPRHGSTLYIPVSAFPFLTYCGEKRDEEQSRSMCVRIIKA